tara:strand:+ start:1170 stop:1652 length:483 start_codon:yes stop_codon:yes gene_type:complete
MMKKYILCTLLAGFCGSSLLANDNLKEGFLLADGAARITGDENFRAVEFESADQDTTVLVECYLNNDLRVSVLLNLQPNIDNFTEANIILERDDGRSSSFNGLLHNIEGTKNKVFLVNPDHLRSKPKRSVRILTALISSRQHAISINAPSLGLTVQKTSM